MVHNSQFHEFPLTSPLRKMLIDPTPIPIPWSAVRLGQITGDQKAMRRKEIGDELDCSQGFEQVQPAASRNSFSFCVRFKSPTFSGCSEGQLSGFPH